MWNFIKTQPFIQTAETLLKEEPSLLFEGLWDTPKAILALAAAQKLGKSILVITGGNRETRLLDDLMLFSNIPVHAFPSWETLPEEEIAPSPDIIGKRFQILEALMNKQPAILLAPLQAVLQKICCQKTLKEKYQRWKVGDQLLFEKLPEKLTKLGYRRESIAMDKGQFAIRGGILDIFPLSAYDPCRIDFFGDEIEEIRTYDPISQKSIEKQAEIFICPAEELSLIQKESAPCNLLDYLGRDSLIFFDDLLAIEDRWVELKKLPGSQSSLFLSLSDFFKETENSKKIYFTKEPIEKLSETKLSAQTVTFEIFEQKLRAKKAPHPFISIPNFFWEDLEDHQKLKAILERGQSMDLTFLTDSEAEERALKEKVEDLGLPKPKYARGYLSSGFVMGTFALVPYTELTKRYKVHREKWRSSYHTPASEFHELEKGDLVVHFHNGIGKFLGMEKQKNHLGKEEEFLILEYAGGSKLFVPLSQSHLISRYIGTNETAPTLHALGTKKWQKAKVQAQKAIIGYARDLLNLQAMREAKGGYAYTQDSEDMLLFEEEFPFTETEDQLQAIRDIKEDMHSAKAMDRLVCGDVGYGKTEVAMRAAFKAVIDGGKQVAVLVPTTVLAMQHFETFSERMESFPVQVGVASRFVKPKELKKTLEGVSSGSVDILIGTHRIISKDVSFKNLGLLIIDEEQRFGVRAKEHLKKVKVGVDCLTLSATPIPRTLYYSLIGARDMSIINTPPHDRLPIKTILAEREPDLMKNALLRELSRDGQAYVIHNRVESIYGVANEIQKLVPTANIAVVHGQMPADAIDQIFHKFKTGEADILIATTIVENGIDIPNANTMLIDRADAYGMADLYQLRGRVGRWNRPAYAYFLVPRNRSLQEMSRKRLQALVETSGFGGGMKLAMRDLEIRGAGDILGVQQSGNVSAIGFHFYCKLLKRSVDAIKKQVSPSFYDTRVEFPYPANLPSEYIPETNIRMELYHRLGEVTTSEEIDELFEELKDRFGPFPEATLWLYHLSRLRVFASKHHITLLKFAKNTLTVQRQIGKETTEQKCPLPTFTSPEEMEERIIQLLKLGFDLS